MMTFSCTRIIVAEATECLGMKSTKTDIEKPSLLREGFVYF